MNKFIAAATLVFALAAQATQDLRPSEASLLKLLEKARKQESRCDVSYTDKFAKFEASEAQGNLEIKDPKEAKEMMKLLKAGRSTDPKVSNEIVSTLLGKHQDMRGEKVVGALFSWTGCKLFAEYNALRRLLLNHKLQKKGFPTTAELRQRLFDYLKRGSETDSLMTLMQVALVRSAFEGGVIKVQDDLLKNFADLSNRLGELKKKTEAPQREIWEKGQAKNAAKPDEKELQPEEINKILNLTVEGIRNMQPLRKDYAALVTKLKTQNP